MQPATYDLLQYLSFLIDIFLTTFTNQLAKTYKQLRISRTNPDILF